MSRRPTHPHGHPEAAGSTDDARALALGRAVLALLEVLGLGTGPAAPAVYTADALPPDATSRDAFLRRHRERSRARVPGWTRSGQVRAVTHAAWELDVAAETSRPRAPRTSSHALPAANDTAAALDEALGIRVRRAR